MLQKDFDKKIIIDKQITNELQKDSIFQKERMDFYVKKFD